MPRVAVVTVAAGLALLAGCADLDEQIDDVLGDDGGDRVRAASFECDDGREFDLRLSDDRDEARVDTGDETYELERTGREEDRRVYTDDDGVRLEVSNREADLSIPGEPDFEDCERA